MEKGIIVKWYKDNVSNCVRIGDIAVNLKGDKFLGITGSVKGQIFYESNKYFKELTFEEEKDLYFWMRE